MAYPQNGKFPPPERLTTKLKKALTAMLFFPNQVSTKYKGYNHGLKVMAESFNFKYAEDRYKDNIKRVSFFIRVPLAVGFIISLMGFWKQFDEIKYSAARITKIYNVRLTKYNVLKPDQWLIRTKVKVPEVKMWIVIAPFTLGYALALIGSIFLSFNPAFVEEKKIKKVLGLYKMINEDGTPWDLVWTPYGILFFAYNGDPAQLKTNVKFWNTLNFNPDDPKTLDTDSSIFMFKRAYELPSKIPLNLVPLIQEKLKNKVNFEPNEKPSVIDSTEEAIDLTIASETKDKPAAVELGKKVKKPKKTSTGNQAGGVNLNDIDFDQLNANLKAQTDKLKKTVAEATSEVTTDPGESSPDDFDLGSDESEDDQQ